MLCMDTEFTDFNGTELVSVGIADVASDLTFYVEIRDVFDSYGWSAFAQSTVRPLLAGPATAIERGRVGQLLFEWLYAFPRPIVMLTDAPEWDWWLVKEVLQPFLGQLTIEPYRFDSLSLGVELAERMRAARATYHGPGRPEHHALHDALALRAQVLDAISLGWEPDMNLIASSMHSRRKWR